MDSGYITSNESAGRHLFYWFAESASAPETAPFVVWFTGGPGCSGLDAFFNENGPFRVDGDTGKIVRNSFSWNNHANMLWIEQPAGVGFSYSESGNYASDTQSASDNYNLIRSFFKQFPQYASHDFWLAGESYGGMYVPTLADTILKGPDTQLSQQFKGFMLGNPVLLCETSSCSSEVGYPIQFNKYFYSGTISYATFSSWNSNDCNSVFKLGYKGSKLICREIYSKGMSEVGKIAQQIDNILHADLDTDNLFQDLCIGNGTLDRAFSDISLCHPLGMESAEYLNRNDVQTAIHAKVGTQWTTCTDAVDYNSDLATPGLIPVLKDIFVLKPSLRILYYSGDVDIATVNTQTTQACLSELGDVVSIEKQWKPWTINGWHAGYIEQFDRYSFATIKGAGHEAPQYQPRASYELFQRFLFTGSLDEISHEMKLKSRYSQGQRLSDHFSGISSIL